MSDNFKEHEAYEGAKAAAKPVWKSKTVGFSLLFILISIANLVGFADFEADPALVMLLEAVVFAVVRYKTYLPIVFRKV